MKRKSSKVVSLVLITAALASCGETKESQQQNQKVYMRAEGDAPYTEVTEQYSQQRQSSGMGNALLGYMAFRALTGGAGMGYTSNGISSASNVGTNTNKANAYKAQTAARGGFGSSAKAPSASS